MMLRACFILSVISTAVYCNGCASRTLPTGIVCVCNATYCDTIKPLGTITDDTAIIYVTNERGSRLERSEMKKSSTPSGPILSIDRSIQYQEILGIGGSFTDSVGVNLLSISEPARNHLMEAYFGPTGSEYTMGRVPIASTDFSPRIYSYAEIKDDFDMINFTLVQEDFDYKLPFIKQAVSLQANSGGLRLISCPWSAPAWMKSNNMMNNGGQLRGFEGGQYYDAWAKYFVKFFEAYSKEGVDFWATEIQNEPRSGKDPKYLFQSMYMSPQMEANFLVDKLAPELQANLVTKDIKVIACTDQRAVYPDWPIEMFANEAAKNLTYGLSVHWYEDDFKSVSLLTDTHNLFPEKVLIASEASNGFMDPHTYRIRLGDYGRAEKYAHSVIEDMNNFVSAWIDWNLALDMTGGPTWVNNILDATILVDASVDEFYKQPSYYALAHFSKFIKPGARRVHTDMVENVKHFETLTVMNRDGSMVSVLMNTDQNEVQSISLSEVNTSYFINLEVPARSIITVIWQ